LIIFNGVMYMNKKIENLDFTDVDFSKYNNEILEIQEIYKSLRTDKKFMKKFNIFLRKEIEKKYDIYYNRTPINHKQFTKNTNVVSFFVNQKNKDDYREVRGSLSLYS